MFVRGWDDSVGGWFMDKIPFKPTLYVTSTKESKYKTLSGVNVSPVNPGNIVECREFMDNYKNVDGIKVYGQERFLYQFLADEFPGEIEYDQDKIKLWSLDIETASENGFPKPEEAREEVLLGGQHPRSGPGLLRDSRARRPAGGARTHHRRRR